MKAIVLAGGKSSRMGQDKALMMLGNKPVIQYGIDALSSVFDEVYISGSYSRDHFPKGIIEDVIEQKGPMGGICSALEYCREDLFVCSCDMPFISSELIKNMLHRKEENKINVMRYREKVYPVLGIYPYSAIEALKRSIKNGNLRMTAFLEQQNTHYIQYDDNLDDQLLNINTPENFRNAEIILNEF